jgi:SAM-dependent methyltransferase
MEIPKPIHPFPARMAASIPWSVLEKRGSVGPLRVLDPMAGSGTTLVVARRLGHEAFGLDSDPLAALIAAAWCADVNERQVLRVSQRVEAIAADEWRSIRPSDAYPCGADAETRDFVEYWYDLKGRQQLAALARAITEVKARSMRQLLWCAFSRLIVVKQAGASLAMDVAHSRPHRKYEQAPIEPAKVFLKSVRRMLAASPFKDEAGAVVPPAASMRVGDARDLPVDRRTIDMVITSPPYLNAIDYLRGHKLSLVWMQHSIGELRRLRSTSIGTEAGAGRRPGTDKALQRAFDAGLREGKLPNSQAGMYTRYLDDMQAVLAEIRRVLKDDGQAVIVVGDCTVRGAFVKNSAAIKSLAAEMGLRPVAERTRSLPANRRYLPPPQARDAGHDLAKRMRKEVVLTFAAA